MVYYFVVLNVIGVYQAERKHNKTSNYHIINGPDILDFKHYCHQRLPELEYLLWS